MDAETIEQKSDAWFAIRLGKATASRIADVVAKTKSGPSASRRNYLADLVAERLTGVAAEGFVSQAMKDGIDREPAARALYSLMSDAEVQQVGFIDHPRIAMSGASPDGLVGTDGVLEIKCPGIAKHIETLRGEAIDGSYVTQMQWQMACSGREWADFVSFQPLMPPEMQIVIKRVPRDPARIVELEREVETFLAELDRTIAELRQLYPRAT